MNCFPTISRRPREISTSPGRRCRFTDDVGSLATVPHWPHWGRFPRKINKNTHKKTLPLFFPPFTLGVCLRHSMWREHRYTKVLRSVSRQLYLYHIWWEESQWYGEKSSKIATAFKIKSRKTKKQKKNKERKRQFSYICFRCCPDVTKTWKSQFDWRHNVWNAG